MLRIGTSSLCCSFKKNVFMKCVDLCIDDCLSNVASVVLVQFRFVITLQSHYNQLLSCFIIKYQELDYIQMKRVPWCKTPTNLEYCTTGIDKCCVSQVEWHSFLPAFQDPWNSPVREQASWDFIVQEAKWLANDVMQVRLIKMS